MDELNIDVQLAAELPLKHKSIGDILGRHREQVRPFPLENTFLSLKPTLKR